ncbi:MAG: hypothetical protein HZB51_17390 [Chloroflexi bacterium]|nr:hypothetical protein [Chloroflexota bacterium]
MIDTKRDEVIKELPIATSDFASMGMATSQELYVSGLRIIDTREDKLILEPKGDRDVTGIRSFYALAGVWKR